MKTYKILVSKYITVMADDETDAIDQAENIMGKENPLFFDYDIIDEWELNVE